MAVVALRSPNRQSSTSAATGQSTATAVSSVPSVSSAPSAPSSRPSASPTAKPSSRPSASTTSSAASSPSTDGHTGGSVRSVPLVVLNNTTTSGLAAQAAKRFEQGGWTVTSYGDLTNEIISTCAYYDPSVPGAQAAALALQQQYPTIKRVKAKFSGLPAGPVVVVLTPDYSPN